MLLSGLVQVHNTAPSLQPAPPLHPLANTTLTAQILQKKMSRPSIKALVPKGFPTGGNCLRTGHLISRMLALRCHSISNHRTYRTLFKHIANSTCRLERSIANPKALSRTQTCGKTTHSSATLIESHNAALQPQPWILLRPMAPGTERSDMLRNSFLINKSFKDPSIRRASPRMAARDSAKLALSPATLTALSTVAGYPETPSSTRHTDTKTRVPYLGIFRYNPSVEGAAKPPCPGKFSERDTCNANMGGADLEAGSQHLAAQAAHG